MPIEVKSGKDYDRHNALTNVMESAEYDIPKALVLCNDNVKVDGKIVYMPIYMLMFLEKEDLTDLKYKIDLSDLKA